MVVPSTGFAPIRHLGSLGLAWTLILSKAFNVVNADCAAGSSTLTTGGCSACEDYDLCRGFTSASECLGPSCKTGGNCSYECLNVNPDSTTLAVLVDLNEQEVTAGGYTTAGLAGYPDETSEWPSVTNDQVTALGMINLSPKVTTFIVSGGSTASEYPKGNVSSITFTSSFISLETKVAKVVLQNLDLRPQINLLPDFLPSSVKSLDLSNTLMSAFPKELGDMPALQRLLLDNNYLTNLSIEDAIDSITTLSLENNNIDTFEAAFPKLEYLYLGKNNLTSIPFVIYSFSNLKTLNLAGNAFSSRYFTSDQAKFLKNLSTLTLSEPDFQVGVWCDNTEQILIHGVTVCITDGNSASDMTDASRSTQVDDLDSNSSTTSNSSLMRVMLGMVYGFSAVLLVGIFLVTSLRKKKKNGVKHPDVNESAGYSGDNSLHLENSAQQLKKSHGGLKTSNRYARGHSMGILTSPRDDDDSVDIPILEATKNASKSPSFVTTADGGSNVKPDRFMSIWNDYELLSLQLCASAIKDIKQLDCGAYSTVWLVHYRNLQLLASKRLRLERCTKKNTAAFVEEIKLIANFDHPNLINLVGAAWTNESDLQMLVEYMDGGDLHRYLSNQSTPTGWTCHKFDIAIGIIEALVYLHSFVPPLLHRDLKSKNVLLSMNLKAKLSDFGKSRFHSDTDRMTGGVGTGRWLAPEVIRGDTDYDCSADIYSFGVLLTELDTNKIPYRNTRGPNGKVLSDTTILHQVATGRLQPKVRSTCEQSLKDLIKRCLDLEPRKRPTTPDIAIELRTIQQSMAATLSKRAPWTTDFIGREAKC